MKIAVIVPTIRPESWNDFTHYWDELFVKHGVLLIKVDDQSKYPDVITLDYTKNNLVPDKIITINKPLDWVFNKTDGCRNLGFYAAYLQSAEIFISLDDDVYPLPGTDPIQDHINALNMQVSPNWMSTAQDWRVRGIPVGGEKWPVMLSHGVWVGVPDFDAPTQLLNPNVQNIAFNRTNVPHGVLFPLCIMNVAFRRELLPWMYQAPMGQRLAEFGLPVGDRFADIWSGVVAKLACDLNQWGVVTGYSTIYHSRASNVFTNLRKEAIFMEQNETFVRDWQDQATTNEYILLYRRMLNAWQKDLLNE
jgi:reversibly glycosylated polypeptide/UDP-arabinopyranose mutase